MKKELILQYLKSKKDHFKKDYNVEKIGLFGSYARNSENINSDIDIFVQMKPDFLKLLSLKEEIENHFNIKVDIVRLRDKMNPSLRKRILRDGIYV